MSTTNRFDGSSYATADGVATICSTPTCPAKG